MGGIFNDRQVVVMRNKESLDFHTPGCRSMVVDVTHISERDNE